MIFCFFFLLWSDCFDCGPVGYVFYICLRWNLWSHVFFFFDFCLNVICLGDCLCFAFFAWIRWLRNYGGGGVINYIKMRNEEIRKELEERDKLY